MARRWVHIGWVGLVAVLLSCGSDNSAGSMQTQCHQIMVAFCRRAFQECTPSSSDFDACVDTGTSACCQNQCGANSAAAQSNIDQCSSEMHSIPCSTLTDPSTVSGALPTDCRGLVRPASVELPMTPGWNLESAMSTALQTK
jgi:hypothetical protein